VKKKKTGATVKVAPVVFHFNEGYFYLKIVVSGRKLPMVTKTLMV
jgi:hypothetical protein